MNHIFKNLTVIELASVLAGPQVGQFFAELGARVIKIENPNTGGDVTRSWKLPSEDPTSDRSAYFTSSNWGKKSLTLNLKETTELQKLYKLIEKADIVIASYKSGDAQKLGVSYQDLKKINPQLIYGHITGYGLDSKRVGYDAIIQAEAGFLAMNGEADGNAVKMPVALIDILAAHQLKEAILIALLEKTQTQLGKYVAVSLFDTAIASLANQASNWLTAGHIPQRMGSQHPNIAPYGDTFRTQDDKQILLAVGNDKQFVALCKLLDLTDLAQDKRFLNNNLRVKNRASLIAALSPAFAQQKGEVLLKQLQQQKIPAGSINNMKQVFEQAKAQALVFQAGKLAGVQTFVATEQKPQLSSPPTLGQDNALLENEL